MGATRPVSRAVTRSVTRKPIGLKFALGSSDTGDVSWTLLAHYACDDNAASGVVLDSENDYDAALDSGNTSTFSAPGQVNTALQLTNGNYIKVNSPYHAVSATKLKIEGYFKISAWGIEGGLGEYLTLADSGTGDPDDNNGFYIIVDNRLSRNNWISFAIMTEGGLHNVHTDGGLLSLDTWYKIVCSYSDGTAEISIDGDSKELTATSYGSGDFSPRDAILAIGAINSGVETLDGYVDEIKLYY